MIWKSARPTRIAAAPATPQNSNTNEAMRSALTHELVAWWAYTVARTVATATPSGKQPLRATPDALEIGELAVGLAPALLDH